MATVIEEFVAKLGWDVDTKGIDQFEKSVQTTSADFDELVNKAKLADAAANQIDAKGIKTVDANVVNAGISMQQFNRQLKDAGIEYNVLIEKAKKFATWVSVGVGAVSAATVAINQHTTEQTNLARSVGLSADSLIAWTGVVKEIGFQADNVVDLVEEMNNKIGEKAGLGKMTAVEESFKLLKLDFKTIRKLKPEEQFFKILDAAKELKDVQKAVSAVDMLLGGEANKILGFLRTQEESLEEIIKRRKALILLDEEGREGALKFTRAWGLFAGVVSSLGQQFAGLLGDTLTPAANTFIDFVAANRKLIRVETKKWVERVSKVLKFFFGILKEIILLVQKVTKSLGGFDNALKILAITLATLKAVQIFRAIQIAIKGVTVAQTLLTAATKAFAAIKTLGLVAGIALLILVVEDLYHWITGGNSLLKELSREFEGIIGGVVERLAGVFGITKDELDLLMVRALEDVVEFFTGIFDSSVEMVEKVIGAFDKLFTGSEDVFTRILNFAMTTAKAISDGWLAVFNNLIDTIVGGVQRLINKVPFLADLVAGGKDFLSGIRAQVSPLTDMLSGKATVIKEGVQGVIGGVTAPTTALAQAGNVQNQTSRVNVENKINVTQLPGEDGANFATRVARVIEESTATAVRNNQTGVVY
jgi:hypothetical protein